MRHRSFVIPAVIVGVLLFGAIGAFAYDSSRDDLIADGVTVGGVDVGGMRAAKAKETLRAELGRSLQRPIEIAAGKKRYELSPREVGVKPDVGQMVDAAVQKSRGGNIIGRVVRDVTGGEEKATLTAQASYSRRAVNRYVKTIERKVNQPAHDARLDFPSLKQVKERNGYKVQDDSFRRRVEQALVVPAIDRVEVPVDVTRPKVTRRQLAAKYPTLIVVERGSFKLTLYKRLRRVKTYTIAVGQVGLETPAGLYRIQNKQVDPAWNVPKSSWAGSLAGKVIPSGSPDNPLKARWLGIYDGAGIHGTDQLASLGTAASHGCIRMAIPDVKQLYDKVSVGAPVYIA